MKIKSKALLMLLLFVLLTFSLTGCAKCINTEYKNVEVTIVDEYHRSMWMQPMRVGKVNTTITHPARYEITIEYNGVQYVIDERDTYDKYKDKIGQTTIGKFEINTYDNGNIQYNILSLE